MWDPDSVPADPDGYRAWLMGTDGGPCVEVKFLDPERSRYAAIKPLLFHWTLITGAVGDPYGYDDRWCYPDREVAHRALAEWDGAGEPRGWHRHPNSNRRRPDRTPASEIVAP